MAHFHHQSLYHLMITMMVHEPYLREARCSFATFLVMVAENNIVLGESQEEIK